jgi:hypothetical protein
MLNDCGLQGCVAGLKSENRKSISHALLLASNGLSTMFQKISKTQWHHYILFNQKYFFHYFEVCICYNHSRANTAHSESKESENMMNIPDAILSEFGLVIDHFNKTNFLII